MRLPKIPNYATNNGHVFYLVCNSLEQRSALIQYLRERNVYAVFHYLSLHLSEYYNEKHDGRSLPNCEYFADNLVRLPLFYELTDDDLEVTINTVSSFFG